MTGGRRQANPERVVVDVVHCARCDGSHSALEFRRHTTPVQIGNLFFRYWALCPATNQRINLRHVETGAAETETQS